MKRSEMISKIAEVLNDTYALSYTDIAQAVLSKMEGLGMKPPVEETDPVLFQTTFTWEKENAQD